MNTESKLVVFEDFNAMRHAESIINSIINSANKVLVNYNALGMKTPLSIRDISDLAGRTKEGVEAFLRERIFAEHTGGKAEINGLEIDEAHLIKMVKVPNYTALLNSLYQLEKSKEQLHQFQADEQYRVFVNDWKRMLRIVNNKVEIDNEVYQAECDRAFRIIVSGETNVSTYKKIEEFCAFLNSAVVAKTQDPTQWVRPTKLAGDLFAFNSQQSRFEINPHFFKATTRN